MGPYGEGAVLSYIRKQHLLAEEGSYFVINNGQTGITPPLGTSFSATVAACIIYNNDPVKKLYLDYISLTNTVAVTATSATAGAPNFAALVIDNGNRYSSGGTVLPLGVAPNESIGTTPSNVTAYFGNLTATAATGAARTICGQRVTRLNASTSAITVVGDTFDFNFGGVERAIANNPTLTNPCITPIPMPPVVLGQNQSAVLYLWWVNSTPAGGASGFLPEIGFFLR